MNKRGDDQKKEDQAAAALVSTVLRVGRMLWATLTIVVVAAVGGATWVAQIESENKNTRERIAVIEARVAPLILPIAQERFENMTRENHAIHNAFDRRVSVLESRH